MIFAIFVKQKATADANKLSFIFIARYASNLTYECRDEKMIFEAVLVFCSLSNPSVCKERIYPMNFDNTNITPYTCMVNAQMTAAEFLQDYPDWRLAKWGCNRVHKDNT
jgi:hypothetical protein